MLACRALSCFLMAAYGAAGAAAHDDMARLPAGQFRPLYSAASAPQVWVKAFRLDATPVTNADFFHFVQSHPQWAPENMAAMFAEPGYLRHWSFTGPGREGRGPAPELARRPVVNVSWFAASAYCKAQGKRLPTIREWEYAARASATQADGSRQPGYVRQILDWYAQPAGKPLPDVGQTAANYWGVHDIHGVIWEWTQDFNVSEVLRTQQSNVQTFVIGGRPQQVDVGAFCGAGAAGVADPSDYAAFMRYSFRASLKAPFVLNTLGFRCAADEGARYPRLAPQAGP